MLGTLRLLLALAVLLSHAEVRFYGLNPGVIAVVGFYVISGYVMTGLLRRYYPGGADIPRYCLDRLLRLMPPYLAVAALTWLWWMLAGKPATLFLRHEPGIADLVNNLLVVPLNFFMWNDADHYTLIPPSWSLGAEIQFYLLMPLLLLARLRLAALVASVAVFLCASLGLLQTEWFGYRLLPGVLFMFLLGSFLYDAHHAVPSIPALLRRVLPWLAPAAAVLAAVSLAYAGKLMLPYNRETLLGIAFAVPLVHALACRPSRPWDEAAGDLAFSVFLNHFLLIWAVFGKVESVAELLALIAASLALAALIHRFVEAPAQRLRRGLRARP